MHKRTLLSLTLLFITTITASAKLPREAFCCVSIADIVIDPLGDTQSTHQQIKDAYQQLPISWGTDLKDKAACPRAHQILLHEKVTIIDETDNEARIQVPQCLMIQDGKIQFVHGWTLKENLCDITSLRDQTALLPNNDNALALASPYIDQDGNFYSASTQFFVIDQTTENYYVAVFNPQNKEFKNLILPKTICSLESKQLPFHEQRELFCDLISLWANIPNACIPLVWGGASIGQVWDYTDYYASTRSNNNEIFAVWDRPKYGNTLYMGVDASGAIFRAAQIVGIPYFCRNSNTTCVMLDPLGMNEWPQRGDLLWMPGSLSVIDLEQNTLITAMSYTSGYGSLTELPLTALIKDITTYADLVHAYRAGKSLTLLNRDGSIARTVDSFKILKLESVLTT